MGLPLSVRAPRSSPSADHVTLSAARIATHVAAGRVPPERELFLLSAAVVESAAASDLEVVQLGLDGAAALLDAAPDGPNWDSYRGHLNATLQFAWLLLRAGARRPEDPAAATA